jgi:hypothetical protein
MKTSGIVTPIAAFAPVERPEEDEDDTVSEDALPMVVGVGDEDDAVFVGTLLAAVDVGGDIISPPVEVVAITVAGVSDIALVDGSCSGVRNEPPESP